MKHNYSSFSLSLLLSKYKLYSARLQRHLNKGTFKALSASRKKFLVGKVEELRTRIQSLQLKLNGTIAVAALATTLNLSTAEAQVVFQENSAKNPLKLQVTTIDNNSWTSVGSTDLDGDGDLDVLVSDAGNFFYYENTGTASAPNLSLVSGTDSPFDGLAIPKAYPSISFGDVDADGDMDMITGGKFWTSNAVISYYENTGSASAPSFTEYTGINSPIPPLSNYVGYASASLVDIDADGDLDIFVIDGYYGRAYFYENAGTASSPSFNETTVGNPFPTGDITPSGANSYLFTSFSDVDGDGDQDAILGPKNDVVFWYENTGTASAASMTLQTDNNPFAGFSGQWMAPALADLNDDGALDLLIGEKDQTLFVLNSGTATAPEFIAAQSYVRINTVDMDGDSDLDLIFTDRNGQLTYRVNNGPATAPSFTVVTGTNNPVDGAPPIMVVDFADVDGDNDPDVLFEDNLGDFTYVQNAGSSTQANFNPVTGTDNPFNLLPAGGNAYSNNFIDIDNDGDLDLFVFHSLGATSFFQNSGSSTAPVYNVITGSDNPLDFVTTSTFPYASFADLDQDGDQDLLVGEYQTLRFFVNNGSATAPLFSELTGTDNPFDVINGITPAPTFMDIDGDGDEDLFVGDINGTITLYENISLVTSVNGSTSGSFSSDLIAYPNPVKDQLNFSLNDAIGSDMNVTVVDMQGVAVSGTSVVNNGSAMSVDVSSLRPGVYALRLNNGAKSATVKFVKQ